MKWRARLRRLARVLLALFAALILIIGTEIVAGWRCAVQGEAQAPIPQPPERKTLTADIRDYARPEDDAYLSYPEWYIVWSYQEKADFQQMRLPSGFPYFSAVRQYWSSYCCISRLMRGKYPFNAGEEVMLVVIGTSFSVEYVLKGAYEKTIGRLSEWTGGHQPVEEDDYAYKVAREYADFVHNRPFYEFHFAHHVNRLWRETPLWGAHWLRKWERKAFLTADYTIEAFYCWLIEKTTHVTYGYEPAYTYVWIENANESVFQQLPRVKKVKQAGPQAFIVDVPRYQEFTSTAEALAERKVQFVNIAGNSHITLSVLADSAWRYDQPDAKVLFSAPSLTHLGLKRAVIGCDVSSLGGVLNTLAAKNVIVEHVYDY
jgi:hypothetical protein